MKTLEQTADSLGRPSETRPLSYCHGPACPGHCRQRVPRQMARRSRTGATANRRQVETHGRCVTVMAATRDTPGYRLRAAIHASDISTARRGWPACAGHDDEDPPSIRLNLPAIRCNLAGRGTPDPVVMAAEGPPSTPFRGFDTARCGCRACARHDANATAAAKPAPMRTSQAMTGTRRGRCVSTKLRLAVEPLPLGTAHGSVSSSLFSRSSSPVRVRTRTGSALI
jgi:hypothetical protein